MYTTSYKGYYITGNFDRDEVRIICRDHTVIHASSVVAAKRIITRLVSSINEYA